MRLRAAERAEAALHNANLETRPASPHGREVLAKIDWIESQMHIQWWNMNYRSRKRRESIIAQVKAASLKSAATRQANSSASTSSEPNSDADRGQK